MAKVRLRRARREDAERIAEIWRLGWHDAHDGLVPQALVEARTAESFRTPAAGRVGDTTVAVVDGEVAGFVMIVGDEVEQIYVAAASRGTGVAGVLLHEAERQVAESGYDRAWLAVVPGNARARAFYEKSGWRDEGSFDYPAPTGDGSVALACHRYAKAVSAA
jgi:ribosomal protein S18 acetylase RimI-like enzyme